MIKDLEEEKDSNNSINNDYDKIFENQNENSSDTITTEDEVNEIVEIHDNKKRNTYFFSERKKDSVFNRKSYGFQLKPNLDEFIELYQKGKEYEYRWEIQSKFIIEGPVLRIQWANCEFGNLFACSGFNKWIYIQ